MSAAPAPQPQAHVPTLYQLCVHQLVANIERVVSLDNLPEPVVFELFLGVLSAGALNVRLVKLFTATGHDLVLQAIKDLDLKDPPPLLDDTPNPWLGY